ncbi:MAG TPA: glutamate-cysteine ligase family protein [Longimicrobiales bacterium]
MRGARLSRRRVAALTADLRDRVFAPAGGSDCAPRIGAEVELIPVVADTRAVCPIDEPGTPSSLPVLCRVAERFGWIRDDDDCRGPRFRLPNGGIIGFEPGGQIEYSTPACRSATTLLDHLRTVIPALEAAAADAGIELLGTGIDPHNPIDRVPLRLRAERYRRMADYFAALGPFGARMMRQTAAVQISLDFGSDPALSWRVLNAAAPYLIAIFANSPRYMGRPTGHRSIRAQVWRELDPSRTGIFPCDDAIAEYLAFALDAPAMLLGNGDDWRPFAHWLAADKVGPDDWRSHLTTLFPEVRPRGYLEVRAIDALRPCWYAAPIALLAGITYHPASRAAAADLLGRPDPALLRCAGQSGLADPAVATRARDLFEIALRGCAALGTGFLAPADLETAAAFFGRYTRHGRAPADGE